jgi:transposase
MGAIRVKDGHFARKYRRIKARSGHKTAIGAVKHAILIALYHMLKTGELYRPPIVHPDAERKQRERTTNVSSASSNVSGTASRSKRQRQRQTAQAAVAP